MPPKSPARRASSAGLAGGAGAGTAPPAAASSSLLALAARAQALVGLGALSGPEALVAVWFALDTFTHFVIEGLYLFFALQDGGAEKSTSVAAFIWREYGKADARWMQCTYLDNTAHRPWLWAALGVGAAVLALYS